MISDLRSFPAGHVLEADVCIIGGGAAGISMAMQFHGTKTRVCLLEGGGEHMEADSQALYHVDNEGQVPVQGMQSRLRMFGGTTNHWTGRCAPLDAVDFAARSWVPHSGWPITRADLDPFYERAQGICDLGNYFYDEDVLEALGVPDMQLDRDKLEPQCWQMSGPTRFAGKYGAVLRVVENIQVVLHATATSVALNPEGTQVEHIALSTPEGTRHRVKARYYVLAAGGIENPRLLLMSDDVQKTGVGNQRDLVGRFFMEHLRVDATLVMEGDPHLVSRMYARHDSSFGNYVVGVRLCDRFQEASKVLNGSVTTYREGGLDPDSGTSSLTRLADELKSGHWPKDAGREIFNVVADFSDVALNVRRRFLRPGAEPYSRTLRQILLEGEQSPNPSSRIRLAEATDALGMRRVMADWRLTELDRHSTQLLVLTVATEMARLYKARMSIPFWLGDSQTDWSRHLRDVAHHIGTTRMADSEQKGVVDADCRVFGVPNLFVAGSSVFPTGGQANPTLTIVALALRLADHLKGKLA
ncbi:MAG TPA: GMC family oxidoreductase [Steroidobacteraceae bacterium]|nr:GMC family oxidoreductase [Steroidobacteraceae bacterium]